MLGYGFGINIEGESALG